MLRIIEIAAASLTYYSLSLRVRSRDRKVVTPIRPRPYAHSALTTGFGSLVTPSMNKSSPCGPKFCIEISALSLTYLSLSERHL